MNVPRRAADSGRVLYIMGRGRSGSTIFANILGEAEGFFSAGEVRYLWDPVLTTGGSCGCGEPVSVCPVWSQVLGRLTDLDLEQVVAWQQEIVRERNLYRILRREPDRATGWTALDGYSAAMGRVYRALEAATGASVIVDSSKRPSYAAVVRQIPGLAPYFVHLVRDPRASAYSWRHRKHASARDRGRDVTRRNAADSTLRWTLLNFGAEAVLRRHGTGGSMSLRYEDFVAKPRTTAERVAQWAGRRSARLPFLDERTARLGANHTLSGNPARFSSGTVTLRDWEEWRSEQSRADKLTATALALPYLRRYDYPLRSPS